MGHLTNPTGFRLGRSLKWQLKNSAFTANPQHLGIFFLVREYFCFYFAKNYEKNFTFPRFFRRWFSKIIFLFSRYNVFFKKKVFFFLSSMYIKQVQKSAIKNFYLRSWAKKKKGVLRAFW